MFQLSDVFTCSWLESASAWLGRVLVVVTQVQVEVWEVADVVGDIQ